MSEQTQQNDFEICEPCTAYYQEKKGQFLLAQGSFEATAKLFDGFCPECRKNIEEAAK